jgi:hypothetical protein
MLSAKDLAPIDVYGICRDERGHRRKVTLNLGPNEWAALDSVASELALTRTQMARRLVCYALRVMNKQ